MRVLINETGASDDDLRGCYAPGAASWLRVNFVSTLDGAATGGDGRSGSINNDADEQVFDLLRDLADVVVVGAGTLRAEGYGPLDEAPLVVVSRRADVPERLRDAEPGRVLLATWAGAEGLAEARDLLGAEHVLVTGENDMDLVAMRAQLAGRGWDQVLCEGGPHLFHDLLAAGQVDELDLTFSPLLVSGAGPRILAGAGLAAAVRPVLLLESDATLLGRWEVAPPEL